MKKTLNKIGAGLAVLATCFLPQICRAATQTRAPNPELISGGESSAQLFSCAFATRGGSEAVSPSQIPIGFTMADFTGDGNPDLAAVEVNSSAVSSGERYQIEVRLTEGGRQFLEVSGQHGRLFVTAKDVTGDGTLDLVVRVTGSQAPIAVFLNDGCGHFSSLETSPFGRGIQDSPPGDEETSRELRFESPLVNASPYMAVYEPDSHRHHELGQRSRPALNELAVATSSRSVGSNRAPPTA